MLIVSQDRTKTTQKLELYIQRNSDTDEELQFEIKSVSSGTFGGYTTEARAKEILIEIAREFKRVIRTQSRETGQITFYDVPKVYYMPKE